MLPHQASILEGNSKEGLLNEAKHLAALVCCMDPDPALKPCGKCLHCRQLEKETYPYWFTIMPRGAANTIQIGQVRELQAALMSKAGEGQWKVAVFLEAERLREEAQNCLLKILEEPPEETLLLLLTGKPQNLLPTVRSRCRILRFHFERPAPEPEEIELVLDVLQAIQQRGYYSVFEKAAFIEGSRKKRLSTFFDGLEYVLRNALIRNLCAGKGYSTDRGKASLASLCEALDRVWHAGYLAERNVNALLILENLFLHIKKLDIRVDPMEGGCMN